MKSIALSKKLLRDLDEKLLNFPLTGENRLMMIESSFYLVDKSIEQLKTNIRSYQFESEQEEIHFFKKYMTEFFSRSHFFSELFHIESEKPEQDGKVLGLYYAEKLQEIKKYFLRNTALNNYLIMGKTHLDRVYFLRSAEAPLIYPDLFRHTLDTNFCTVYTLYFARLMGITRLMNFLIQELSGFSGIKSFTKEKPDPKMKLCWTGSKVELVELIYALKASTSVNSGTATISDMASVMGRVFGKELRGFYKTFEEIRSRRKSKTLFLDKCKERLEDLIETYDDKL